MKLRMRVALSGGLVAALATCAGVGSAQVKESKTDLGYGYRFDDDPLNAGGFGSDAATIRIRINAPRVTLIRPRSSFVPEMLKSVEHL